MTTKKIVRTAVLLALLVALQAATKPLGSQILTGSCVNLVLAVAALLEGVWSAGVIAVLSPLFAYLLGISPQVWLTPAIACGNLVYVIILALLNRSRHDDPGRGVLSLLLGAAAKFAALWLLVVKLLIPAGNLPAPVAVQFSWPQLVTALIGGALALIIVPRLRRALRL